MQRMALILLVWLAGLTAALAQNVTVIGPITPGNCPQFSSTTVLKDSGALCNGSSPTSPSASVGLTVVPGTATSAMRSDAAPPLSASVQSALTGTNNGVALGTGAFGFGATAVGANSQALFGNTGLAPTFRQPAFTDLTGTATPTQGGTGANNATNAANDILASNGANGNFVHTAFSTLVNAFCTASPSSCASVFGYVSPFWYGAKCDGTTNDATALQNLINAAAGATILIPAETCLSNSTLTLPTATHITGVSREMSVLKSGVVNGPLFSATNQSNIELDHFWCLGTDNATSWSGSPIGCLYFTQNVSATVAGSNLNLHDLKLTNFNSTYWVYINLAGTTHPFSDVTITHNYVLTASADIPTDGTPTNDTNGIFVMLSGSAGNGQIRNVQVKDNRIDANSACFPIILYSNYYRWQITENLILSPGQTTSTHCNNASATTINAYGILVYDLNSDGNPPQHGLVANNTIYNPYASGIYFAGDGTAGHYTAGYNSFQADVIGNNVILQTSSDDALLPRGGIVINTATDIIISGNYLYQGYGGIALTGQNAGHISVIGNHCSSGAGSSSCLKMSAGANGSSNTDIRTISGNYFNASLNGISLTSGTGFRFNTVNITGNDIVGGTNGTNLNSPFVGNEIILDNNVTSGSTGLNIGTMTGSIELKGNTILNTASAGIAFAALPSAINSSQVFLSDGTAGSSPCTGGGTGTTAMRQNGAWKCF